MNRAEHWEKVYRARRPEEVSWYQEDPALSLRLIRQNTAGLDDPIIDVGGGASRVVDRLVDAGYQNVTVLDVSPTGLSRARERLGDRARRVTWVEADIVTHPFGTTYRVWHDRAVFHFLTDPGDRAAYVRSMAAAVAKAGSVIVAAFGPEGPQACSGLPVVRYSPEALAAEVGDAFVLVDHEEETHRTPAGVSQHFGYSVFRRA